RENVAPLVENVISGTSMGRLIVQPTGCGEQTMIRMTLPVIATTYLDRTNQWETVGFQRRDEAIHLEILESKKWCFCFWTYFFACSSWLTAYVVKVFAMAYDLVAIDNDVICNAVKYLILNTQQPDGMFREVGNVWMYDVAMTGDVRGSDSDASMTAFCLITMQESRKICADTVNVSPSPLSKGRARIISKYEMDTLLSEKGSLIIYLDKVSHKQSEEITFRIHQTMNVGVLQPAAVSVYEYYDQKHCVKFYHPERRAGQLMQLCRNDECTCAEENCSMQKKGKISNDDRTTKLCESTQTSKIDYVYKVAVEGFTDGLSTDIYTVRVQDVIKEEPG
uniref:complement C3-like n=1 Tax=Monopterus albus TaxID=43700 RepID=UPI0009B4E860